MIRNSCHPEFEYKPYAVLTGLFHDAGKGTSFFQKYLQTGKRHGDLSDHALIAAHLFAHAISRFGADEDKSYGALLGFLAIAKHHGNFNHDIPSLISGYRDGLEKRNQTTLTRQLKALDLQGLSEFINHMVQEYGLPLDTVRFGPAGELPGEFLQTFWSISSFGQNSLTRLTREHPDFFQDLYYTCGLLWQADKIHTASRRSEVRQSPIPSDLVDTYLQDLIPENRFDEIRAEIHDQVLNAIDSHSLERLFTLTAPTGSGKTLTLLDAALTLKSRIQARRIIYCLPFTSVIEQNHAVFLDVLAQRFGRDNVLEDRLLKHHHLSEPVYQEQDAKPRELSPDGQALFVETWQSELVVTTFHQLLSSIFSARNRNIKRFPQLCRAVIILDEVQAIPVKYWEIVGRLLSSISRCFQSAVILATATKPLIFTPDMGARELLAGHEDYYRMLSRIQLVNRACSNGQPYQTPFSEFLEELAQKVTGEQNVLLVLNTKNAVKQAYDYFQENRTMPRENILLLSKSLTPEDRLAKIEAIRNRMNSGEKLLVVSTQLIEAGVDLSFDWVHRDLAPLDCIVQTAGRCNRHWREGKQGTVHLWYLFDDHKEKPYFFSRIYDPVLLDITLQTLAGFPEKILESQFLELSEAFFQLARARAAGSGSQVIEGLIKDMKFDELDDAFRLIEDYIPATTYFVVKDDRDRLLWDRYLELKNIDNALERKRTFQEFKRAFMEKTVDVYSRSRSEEHLVLPAYMDLGHYCEEYGLDETALSKGEGTLCL